MLADVCGTVRLWEGEYLRRPIPPCTDWTGTGNSAHNPGSWSGRAVYGSVRLSVLPVETLRRVPVS